MSAGTCIRFEPLCFSRILLLFSPNICRSGADQSGDRTYQHAISLEPDLTVAHYQLGKIWQHQENHAAAAACFQRVMQLQPDQPEVYGDCGLALLALGKFTEAMRCWQRAIALQPIFVKSFCQRVASLTESDSLTQSKIACGQFLTALQHQPDDPSVSVYLQRIYLHLADALTEYGGREIYQQAKTYYHQALQLQPQNLMLHLKLGDCLVKQRRLEAAIAHYRQGLGCASESSEPPPFPLASPLSSPLQGTYRSTQDWVKAQGDRHQYIPLMRSVTQSFPTAHPPSPHLPISPSSTHWLSPKKFDKVFHSLG
ncbi:MAG: tetratricopeptide repeat protein [Leptolyngbyaceae cyanobacterium SM1_4_3]|nr:tetratricopeptide repeat protein [Leptolyngbyaceae cyanobacterium SM1_4_3]